MKNTTKRAFEEGSMSMLIAVVAVAAFVGGSVWLWNIRAITKKALTISLGLALVVSSVLYWISERTV